jgi:hypothetical protein
VPLLPLACDILPFLNAIARRIPGFLRPPDLPHLRQQASSWRALFYFQVGSHLLQRSRPQAAWDRFESALQGATDPHHYFVAAVCLLHGLGRARDALSCFARASELNLQRTRALGVSPMRYRVLDNFWTGNIGHTAGLDYVIKLGEQEGRNRNDTILYVAPGSIVANRCLVEQFRPHLRLIEHPADLPFDASAVPALR